MSSKVKVLAIATLISLAIGLFVCVDDWCQAQWMAVAKQQDTFARLKAVEGGVNAAGQPFLTVENTSRVSAIRAKRANFYVVEDWISAEPMRPRYVGIEQRSLEAAIDSHVIVFQERDASSTEELAFAAQLDFNMKDDANARNLFVRIHDDELAGHIVNGILAITYEVDGERRVFSQKAEGLLVSPATSHFPG